MQHRYNINFQGEHELLVLIHTHVHVAACMHAFTWHHMRWSSEITRGITIVIMQFQQGRYRHSIHINRLPSWQRAPCYHSPHKVTLLALPSLDKSNHVPSRSLPILINQEFQRVRSKTIRRPYCIPVDLNTPYGIPFRETID